MEWLSKVFQYSDLEKAVLAENNEPSTFKRYATTVSVDGRQVHAVSAPSSNAKKIPKLPTVVMLHGIGGTMQCFSPLVPVLNAYCDLVLIDLPADVVEWHEILRVLQAAIKSLVDGDIVLIGHSYGTSHALRLAASGDLHERVRGVVCITPPYGHMLPGYARTIIGFLPPLLFDVVVRSRDRVGGLNSPSVARMVAKTTGEEARRSQLRINLQSKSASVLQNVSRGKFYDVEEGVPRCPVYIISALEDQVCPPAKAQQLFDALRSRGVSVDITKVGNAGHAVILEQTEIVAGLIGMFLRKSVDERLSQQWQLSYLASLDNKWSLKNEAKWKATLPVGEQVGPFKGMKVLRTGDPVHGPKVFEAAHPEITAIIDITREAPPYDPTEFTRIKYIKFPTVSKIPPSEADVKAFNKLVRQIGKPVIGVHCHYGFNRTGFFICSYLIEEEHYSVRDAIQAFKKSRPPGIRHEHFIDTLYLRYNL